MEIRRGNNSIIQKKKINLTNLPLYDDEKVRFAIRLLRKQIDDSFVWHFDYISYVLKEQKDVNIKISSYIKNSGCISDCKKLKSQLKQVGLQTYYVSCKANGFSNPAGDLLVKEAHTFLVYPSLRNNKLYFTIFDPGFRIDNIIQFYDTQDSCEISYLIEGMAKVIYCENSNYPYRLIVNRRINYKHQISLANIQWDFNPYYQTINITQFNKQLYQAMFCLKLMNYPKDINKYICIRSKILERYIEIYTPRKNQKWFYDDLASLTKEQLKNLFEQYFIDAGLTTKQLTNFIRNLFLLVHHSDIYVNKVINPKVIEDYRLGNNLNR